MTHARNTPARSRSRLVGRAAAGALLCAGLVASAAVPAQAASPGNAVSFGGAGSFAPQQTPGTDPYNLLMTAESYLGTPYRWGGTTPAGFDCSGFVQYVLARHGMYVPRTTNDQLAATRAVAPGDQRPGDLVFYMSGGNAYHMAFYAGNGWIVDSGSSGSSVRLRQMWPGQVVYTRVLV